LKKSLIEMTPQPTTTCPAFRLPFLFYKNKKTKESKRFSTSPNKQKKAGRFLCDDVCFSNLAFSVSFSFLLLFAFK
jgi:hypothetical protein